MTLYLFIPGFSIVNKDEAYNITGKLKEEGKQVYVHEWQHWKDANVEWDKAKEKELILAKIAELAPDKIFIIGKSIGTFVTMQLIPEVSSKLLGLILMGIPSKDIANDEHKIYPETLKQVTCPIYVIQNESDPHSDLNLIKKLLSNIVYTLIIKEASDHRYNYPEEILPIIKAIDPA